MFFYLSKILTFLIQPLNWIIALLLIALLLKDKDQSKKLVFLSLSLLLIFTNPFLINGIFKNWEPRALTYSEIPNHQVAIVLGGFSNSMSTPRDRVHFVKGADRLLHAIELYKLGKVDYILLSGGSSRIIGEKRSEALAVRPFILNMGIPDTALMIEIDSRNTHENAVQSVKTLKERNIKGDFLLITSAFHMRRAKSCFEKEGLSVSTFPTDYYSKEFFWSPGNTILPRSDAFRLWHIIIKEWIGIIAYKLAGYI